MTYYNTLNPGYRQGTRKYSLYEKIVVLIMKFLQFLPGRKSPRVRRFTKDEIKRIVECRDSRLYGNSTQPHSRFASRKK
jgi:hypothetical protein